MHKKSSDKKYKNAFYNALYYYLVSFPKGKDIDIAYEKRKFFEAIEKKKSLSKTKNVTIRHFYKYAAVACVFISITCGFVFYDTIFDNSQNDIPIIVDNNIGSFEDKAFLTLDSGVNIALEDGKYYQSNNANSSGKDITYTKSSDEIINYNTLTVPKNGRFQITLSDGTEVWLNADSKLKYPVSFVDGTTREVELLYGEAYFKVSPSLENEGSSFKVLSSNQEIEVLGTEFNLKTIKNDTNIYTTLVEGKVAVSSKNSGDKKMLLPNYQSIYNRNSEDISTKRVDTFILTCWKDSNYTFNDTSLKDISLILSKWYNVEVKLDKTSAINKIEYRGVLRREKEITTILSLLKETGIINNYSINNTTVILK